MQILLKPNLPGIGAEWVMIELQGQLESPENEQLSGNFMGDLHFNKKGAPILIIGHHILYGKVMTLEKPFLVLTKRSQGGDGNELESMETDQSEVQTDQKYSISAVVKKKLMFKTRPKPIITNVPKRL
ncbi:Chromosome transmission fidelity protein 8-like [Holothuria leucospilota]|uniref:Chromosome transmission fidelity protein 8-like n=1 Tax=Holothuria leucospilota TaxID=206669 RepID=A0A9Q1HD72_HOLLE|nr:Chromosome transmission fidelity protein 8-like [Holothuria leucospilota]